MRRIKFTGETLSPVSTVGTRHHVDGAQGALAENCYGDVSTLGCSSFAKNTATTLGIIVIVTSAGSGPSNVRYADSRGPT